MRALHLSRMLKTSHLKSQHDEILAMAERTLDLIDAYRGVDAEAFRISVQLARLFGLLRIHLMHEDTQFYPWLATCGDAEAERLSHVYFTEMGQLAPQLEQFAQRWSLSSVIETNFEQFRVHARALIATIELRIERENGFLYPVADQVAEEQLNRATPAPPQPLGSAPPIFPPQALRA